MILSLPSAGIIRIRLKGMISARSYKAPHFDNVKVTLFSRSFNLLLILRSNKKEEMQTLVEKLNYKGQRRIALLNAEEDFYKLISSGLKDVIIDREIDQRCPYGFIIAFVKNISEVEQVSPVILHNLMADGVLWYCFPKKSSKKYKSDLGRDTGWNALNDSGLFGIRLVSIDDDWSAFRFRNKKYIKSLNS